MRSLYPRGWHDGMSVVEHHARGAKRGVTDLAYQTLPNFFIAKGSQLSLSSFQGST